MKNRKNRAQETTTRQEMRDPNATPEFKYQIIALVAYLSWMGKLAPELFVLVVLVAILCDRR